MLLSFLTHQTADDSSSSHEFSPTPLGLFPSKRISLDTNTVELLYTILDSELVVEFDLAIKANEDCERS